MARLVSVNVGLPRDIAWRGRTVYTGVWKQPVQGRQLVRRLNIAGDGQGDLAGHGGENRAVMVYQMDSYRHWETHLGRNDLTFGNFGENFTIEGLPDDEVCIGDRYRIGGALLEVTQPRVTCYRVGIRMNEPTMAALLVAHHRPGFYFRVLEEGEVAAGDEITKVADGAGRMTVSGIDALLYLPAHPREQLEAALRITALSEGWKGSFRALLDQGTAGAPTGNSGLSDVAGPPPAWPGFRSLRVARLDRECASVVSLSFAEPDGSPLPPALPGQFLVVRLHVGSDLPPVLRNYSLSSTPGASAYRISVKQEPHGLGSSFLHSHVSVGDNLELSGPRGSFTLRAGDEPVVLLSAGIGATPVLAMLHALASTKSTRQIWWLYGVRNSDDHPFAEESRGLLKTLANCRSHIVYSRPGPEDHLGVQYDSPGHVDVPLLDRLGVPRGADFYLCGPAAFMDSLVADLRTWGVAAPKIHSEVFGPASAITPGIAPTSHIQPHAPAGTAGPGPQVSFTRSGLTAPWNASFQSLLEFAEACDVPVKWSCRTGVCHTCETALIGGAVTYQPDPLEPPSEGALLMCCSQPRGDVEIDL